MADLRPSGESATETRAHDWTKDQRVVAAADERDREFRSADRRRSDRPRLGRGRHARRAAEERPHRFAHTMTKLLVVALALGTTAANLAFEKVMTSEDGGYLGAIASSPDGSQVLASDGLMY